MAMLGLSCRREVEAARWFARNSHRFEQARERIAREKQRASSINAKARERMELS